MSSFFLTVQSRHARKVSCKNHVHTCMMLYTPGHYTPIRSTVNSKHYSIRYDEYIFRKYRNRYAIELTVEYVEPNEQPKFWVPDPVFE